MLLFGNHKRLALAVMDAWTHFKSRSVLFLGHLSQMCDTAITALPRAVISGS
jgi:hypothetical protein